MAKTATVQKQPKKLSSEKKLILLVIRQISIFLLSFLIVVATLWFVFSTVYRELLRPVEPMDPTEIEIEIPMGSSLARIADILSRNDLIRNAFVFELFAEFTDQAHKLRAGNYVLSRNMNMQQIVDQLIVGSDIINVVRFRIPEGYTIKEMAQLLATGVAEDGDKKFEFSAQDFIEAAKEIDIYIEDFPFLEHIPLERRTGEFPLEGYLFPDTYEAYRDVEPETIIRLMLRTFERKVYNREISETTLASRAEMINMTVDEVIVLASIIQAESGFGEFSRVSAVFHNRLSIGMRLEADSTVLFLIPKEEWEGPFATAAQIEATKDSPYNTYRQVGLPAGPISAPSQMAVEAALFPFEEYMPPQKQMLFFVYRGDGTHAFNETYEEHLRDVELYEYRWR